jgi:hypothetical protein
MPDISMCSNNKCEKNKKCYRYMAIPSSWQSYANFDEKDCEYFMPINGRRIDEAKK